MALLDLIICTECKTRVEYHEDSDGYMSCECWVRQTQDEEIPSKWLEIEDQKINECGICRKDVTERLVFRCADCGLPFHRVCLDQHCKHGNQKQELRSEIMFLRGQLLAVRNSCASIYESMMYPQDRNPKIAAAIRGGSPIHTALGSARGEE